jgi:hypothetical protein
MYGHVERLAEEIKKGADSVEGVEAKLWQACIFIYIDNANKCFLPFQLHLQDINH